MPWPLPPSPVDIKVLSFLAGKWEGEGTAVFPTINKTKYFDEIEYELNEEAGLVIYRQKTWYNVDGKKGKTLHVESGFIKIADNTCQLVNSQGNGRTEVMQALFLAAGKEKRVYLTSQVFSNDPRMLQSRRDIKVKDDTLTYELKMATKNTPDIQTHLFSTLKKID